MSLLSGEPFYRLRVTDFVAVRAHELRVGDMLSLAGIGNSYGAILIEHVINSEGQVMVISYTLPVGARMRSHDSTEIAVAWDGKQPTIKVTQLIGAQEKVLVLALNSHRQEVERKEAFLHTFLITLWGVSENNVASIQSKLSTQFGSLQPIPARRPDRLVFAIQRDTWSLKDTAMMEALCDQHQISAWNQREAGLE